MSADNGAYFLEKLQGVDSKHVKEIRGRGLWIAIELNDEAGGARRFCEALQEEGLLCKETHSTVIRVAPPLTISREDIDWAVERIAKVLTTLVDSDSSGIQGPILDSGYSILDLSRRSCEAA